MSNIIRCKFPDGVRRFPMFTISDYRDLLMLRADIELHSKEEQEELMEEILETYFPDVESNYREYVFCAVFLSSIGNTVIPMIVNCPICKKPITIRGNFDHPGLSNIRVKTKYGISLLIRFPSDKNVDIIDYIEENILEVSDDENTYKWENLNPKEKDAIFSIIDKDIIQEIIKKSRPINFNIHTYCCNEKIDIEFNDILSIFKILVHPQELINFYTVNHRMISYNYDLNSIMSMLPIERNISLALIEDDLKKQAMARNKNEQ